MAHVMDLGWTEKARPDRRRLAQVAMLAVGAALLILMRVLLGDATTAYAAPGADSRADIVGQAQINDAGLFIDGREVRLSGVAILPVEAMCGDVSCGIEARRGLHRLVADHDLACRTVAMEGATHVATCRIQGRDLGAELIRRGHASAA